MRACTYMHRHMLTYILINDVEQFSVKDLPLNVPPYTVIEASNPYSSRYRLIATYLPACRGMFHKLVAFIDRPTINAHYPNFQTSNGFLERKEPSTILYTSAASSQRG